jgi:two-component system NarL family sensor kinase
MHANPVRQAVVRYVASALVAVVLISLVGVWLLRRAGQGEAIRDAKDQTRIAALGSVEPALSNSLLRGDPRAIDALDRVVEEQVLSDPSPIVRVKVWDRSGRIVYSNEPRLIGARYPLGPADLAEFREHGTQAEVSDLSEPENRFERRYKRLLEVYMPVELPNGQPLRYEAYYRSSFISARGRRIFRQFVPVMLGGLILLALVQLPLAWRLASRVRRSQREREALLQRAIDASELERRRIARDLHDGVVQDLAGVSYSLSAAAEGAEPPIDRTLRDAAAQTRQGIRQLRTLLLEIYPPELERAGLAAALADLLTACESRGVATELDAAVDLPPESEALFFRVAQESVRNVLKHAGASRVHVSVDREDGHGVLVVEDDGRGFDTRPQNGDGHFGLRMLSDLVRDAGGTLTVGSSAETGTRVRAEVPV